MGHLQHHLAAAAVTQPSLKKFLLWQWVLQQHFCWQLHRIELAVVLFQDPLQDGTWLSSLGISRETQTADQLARSDLKELHSGNTIIGGQGNHIAADPGVRQSHLLIGCEEFQSLQLITHPSSSFKIKPLGIAHHLLLKQVL